MRAPFHRQGGNILSLAAISVALSSCAGPAPALRSDPPPLLPPRDTVAVSTATHGELLDRGIVHGPPPLGDRPSILIHSGTLSPEDQVMANEGISPYAGRPTIKINPSRWGKLGKGTLDGDAHTGSQPDPRAFQYAGPSPYKVHPIKRGKGKGMVLPYPLTFVIKKLGGCRRGRRDHIAIDIAGIGPNFGLATPVRSMARSKVVRVGLPSKDPDEFGDLDTGLGYAHRRGRALPRSLAVAGYGRVHFFTHNYGRWRSGVVISTRVLEGRYKGYKIRYMHLGAVAPGIEVGKVVEAGQEIGLMGCTAILNDIPHVHLDVWTPSDKRRVDPSPILGLRSGRVWCPRSKRRGKKRRGKTRKRSVRAR